MLEIERLLATEKVARKVPGNWWIDLNEPVRGTRVTCHAKVET